MHADSNKYTIYVVHLALMSTVRARHATCRNLTVCWLFFYARELAIARISYGNSVRLSVRPFVCVLVSRPGTVPKPDETETSGFHHMIT